MKYLLVAINAKYIHSNPAIYSLKEYAIANIPNYVNYELTIAEYTINNQIDDILSEIFEKKPDVIAFSCYIWNISYVNLLIGQLKKILPKVIIWCGGPEVSYRASCYLEENNGNVDMVLVGEGEQTITNLICAYEKLCLDKKSAIKSDFFTDEVLSSIKGIAYKDSSNTIREISPSTDFNFDTVPFIYQNTSLKDLANRIIYYESSRGCPFSCSYCLSSIDKCIRFRSLDKVKSELKYFLDNNVPQVKFIDRTFNCNIERATKIWRFIHENDNGITNFHFEIAADLLNEEQLDLISTFRAGLIQLEIGVQTTNPITLAEIKRRCNMDKLTANVLTVNSFKNTHQHLDLIAGLPNEDLESFKKSFNDVYALAPNQLQLGFLKVLSGSYMKEHVAEYGIEYRSYPPYEILSSKWINYSELLELKRLETVLEIYYNSHQFEHTISILGKYFSTPYELYDALGKYYSNKFDVNVKHSRISRYNLLLDFYNDVVKSTKIYKASDNGIDTVTYEVLLPVSSLVIADDNSIIDEGQITLNLNLNYEELLSLDIYERENIKTRPDFSKDQSGCKSKISDLKHKYHLTNQDHIEQYLTLTGQEIYIFFDYNHRNPLNHSAKLNLLFTNIV